MGNRDRHILFGEKVSLRFPTKSDRAEFITLNRASKHFHRGLVAPPTTPEQFSSFLQKSEREDSACLLICLKADGAIIGAINLSQIFRGGFQNAYLGYYVGAQYAGQGYMTEALRLMLKHTFEHLKLHRLEASNLFPLGLNADRAPQLKAVVRRFRVSRDIDL
jgi:ribosomal-protein-alanine N-acetyltransferase